jgi:hypothetical protein
MADQVKVFKNVINQTALGAAHSVTLASTGATERAVIKDVSCRGVLNATLDLDGRTVLTSTQDMVASGSLIMDVSSVLSLKFPYIDVAVPNSFKGMFFSGYADGVNYIEGDGVGDGLNTTMTEITNNRAYGLDTYSSFAAMKNGTLTFFRYYSNTIYEYEATSASPITSYSFGSGFGSCTDGTYMYNIPAGNTTTIYRRHIETGVSTNFNVSTGTVNGQVGNQGSFLEYHDGHLYTKSTASANTMEIIKISDGSVTTITSGSVGNYSDGGCIVTTVAGTSYVVEQGTSYWNWYEIGGTSTTFTNVSGGSNASTEYGDGAVEVAPGIAMIFCEYSDDLTIIDMNNIARLHISSASDRKMAVNDAFSDSFSACGLLTREVKAVNYDAYTSGILITEDA